MTRTRALQTYTTTHAISSNIIIFILNHPRHLLVAPTRRCRPDTRSDPYGLRTHHLPPSRRYGPTGAATVHSQKQMQVKEQLIHHPP